MKIPTHKNGIFPPTKTEALLSQCFCYWNDVFRPAERDVRFARGKEHITARIIRHRECALSLPEAQGHTRAWERCLCP